MTQSEWVWAGAVACALGAVGCVALPAAEQAGEEAAQDGAVAELLELDAGAQRPATGEPYRGPTCAAGDGTGAAAGGAGALTPDGGAGWGGDGTGSGPDDALGADAGASTAAEQAMQGPIGVMPRTAGELVITELMLDPQAMRDDEGEWIELWNAGASETLALSECVLDDGSATQRALTGLVIEAGGFATIARSELVGFAPDLVLAFSLANAADTVAIVCGGVEIDRVRYGAGYPLVPGASLALDPEAWSADGNDLPGAWCAATVAYASDLGTPGSANASCHPEEPPEPEMPGDGGVMLQP